MVRKGKMGRSGPGGRAKGRRPRLDPPASQRAPAPPGPSREPKGRGVAWTEERGTSDEGRQRLKSGPEASGKTEPGSWVRYPAGAAFLAGLAEGRPVRAAWSALPGPEWPAEIAIAAATAAAA